MTTTDSLMSSAPVAVIDLLNSLLEAELNSVFRFMGEGSPYLSRATAEVRKPLAEMVVAGHRRAGEIADTIESLGVVPTPQAGVRTEEQYLAFLSLKFLLPKLVGEKQLIIERYRNALEGVESLPQVPPGVPSLLRVHLLELQAE